MSALFGVVAGITLLSGLICFVLKLFAQSQYPRSRHYANANTVDLSAFQRNSLDLGYFLLFFFNIGRRLFCCIEKYFFTSFRRGLYNLTKP